jgi:hypothetical protein
MVEAGALIDCKSIESELVDLDIGFAGGDEIGQCLADDRCQENAFATSSSGDESAFFAGNFAEYGVAIGGDGSHAGRLQH